MNDKEPPKKRCTKCRASKSLDEYYKSSKTKDGRTQQCSACFKSEKAQRKQENEELVDRTGIPEKKQCRKCGLTKLSSEFHRDGSSRDGLRNKCRTCVKEYDDRNQEARNEKARLAYRADPQAKIDKTRKYHLEHPDWSRERQRASHERNADERARRHRERGNDPIVRQARRDASRRSESRRRAVKRLAGLAELITQQDIRNLLRVYRERCWICGDHFDEDLVIMHLDHIKPLSKGGPHILANLRPACSDCNTRKNDRWPFSPTMRIEVRAVVLSRRAALRTNLAAADAVDSASQEALF
jgi:5-methylcytosine-specific restriction endonuclease McrA